MAGLGGGGGGGGRGEAGRTILMGAGSGFGRGGGCLLVIVDVFLGLWIFIDVGCLEAQLAAEPCTRECVLEVLLRCAGGGGVADEADVGLLEVAPKYCCWVLKPEAS